jgi:hypothetical protein
MNGSISPWRSWKATSILVMARSATCNRKSTGAPTRDGRWLRPRKYRMRCGAARLQDRRTTYQLRSGGPIDRFGGPANRLPVRTEALVVRSRQERPPRASAEDTGSGRPTLSEYRCSGHQHDACGSGPPWAGQAQRSSGNEATRHTAIDQVQPKDLQRADDKGEFTGRSPRLLSADDWRLSPAVVSLPVKPRRAPRKLMPSLFSRMSSRSSACARQAHPLPQASI